MATLTATSRERQLAGFSLGASKKRYYVQYTLGKRVAVEVHGRKISKWFGQEQVVLGPFRYVTQAEGHMIDILGHPSTVPGTAEIIEGYAE